MSSKIFPRNSQIFEKYNKKIKVKFFVFLKVHNFILIFINNIQLHFKYILLSFQILHFKYIYYQHVWTQFVILWRPQYLIYLN